MGLGSYRSRILPWIAVAGGTFAATLYFRNHLVPKAYAESAESNETAEELKVPERKDLPTFRLEEVKKHGKDAEQIWVTYQSVSFQTVFGDRRRLSRKPDL